MSKTYKTNAREAWIELLKYDEKEENYHFLVNFAYGNWNEPNQVVLIFNEKGEFIEVKPFIYNKFIKKTVEETKQDHLLYALQFKEMAEKLIKTLIKPMKKEDIKIIKETTWTDGYDLQIHFELEGEICSYLLNIADPFRNYVTISCEHELGDFIVEIHHNIPSLKGMKAYIRNHPEIRVKYVNELARYEQNKRYEV